MPRKTTSDHEKDKFGTNEDDRSMVRIFEDVGTSIDPSAKFVTMTETSSNIETYNYYEDSSMATLYNTVIVTYTTSTKDILASVAWE